MSLIAPLDQSTSCMTARSRVLQVLSRCETVNNIVALLSINFHQLELDVKREQQMRQKPGAGLTDSVLISALTSGPSLEFERSDATRKLRLVLSELLTLMYSPSTSNVPLGELLTTLSIIIRVRTELIQYCQALVPDPPRPNPNPVKPSSNPKRAQRGQKGTGADTKIL